MWHQHAVQAFLIAAVLAPFSYYAGKAANSVRLPQITGYLISGIICGPYVLAILSQDLVKDLSIIEGACLGIIGLAAGAELQLTELNRHKQQVVALTAGICMLTWIFCFFAIKLAAPLTPMLGSMSKGHITAIATLGGTLMMARSPASAIAVLKEMDAKGPFVSLVMGVVVLKDVVVVVLFAINLQLVPLVLDADSPRLGVLHLLHPLLSVSVSVTGGLLGGYLISRALQHQLHAKMAAAVTASRLTAGISHSAVLNRCKQAVVLLLTTLLFSITRSLDAEPLLACVTAGMLLTNTRGAGSNEFSPEELNLVINSIMTITNVAFFGLAGASLKLAAIADSVWVAVVVFLVRLAAIGLGTWLGCTVGGVKAEKHRQCFWLSMITQAGVAMGLARIAGTAFAEWGPAFQTVMMAIIMINMLVGPPCFRSALLQVGEARAHFLPSVGHQDLHRDLSLMPGNGEAAESTVISRPTNSKTAVKGVWNHSTGRVVPNSNSESVQGQSTAVRSPMKAAGPFEAAEDAASEEYGHHVVVRSETLLLDLADVKDSRTD